MIISRHQTFETLTELMPRLTEGVSLQTNRSAAAFTYVIM